MSAFLKKHKSTLRYTASLLFWLAVWQLASTLVGEQIIVASPLSVFKRLGELLFEASFYSAVLLSLSHICLGFLAAAALGSALGALSFKSKTVRILLDPIMGVIKATPVASFIILALLLASSRHLSALISFLMVLPVFYSNILTALLNLPPQSFEAAAVFGMLPRDRLRFIYLPQLLPYFSSASAVGMGMAWKSGVAAEVIGLATGSIGEMLYEAKLYLDSEQLFACTLAVVLISLLLEKLLRTALAAFEQRVLAG